MGAINVSRLRNTVPGTDSGNPRHQRGWRGIVNDLIALGNPVPGVDPADFPVADLPTTASTIATHLVTHIGALIAAEIAGDSANRNYAGAADDSEIADLMNASYTRNLGLGNRTVLLRRTGAPVGDTISIAAENGEPQSLSSFQSTLPDVFIEFYALTPTVSLRGNQVRVTALTDVTIDLQSVPGAMTDADLFRVASIRTETRPPRRSVIYQRVPFAPRTITAQDVTDAKA